MKTRNGPRRKCVTLAVSIVLAVSLSGLATAGLPYMKKTYDGGGGGGTTTYTVDVVVESIEDSATVSVETDLESSSFSTDGDITTLDTGYDKVSVVPDCTLGVLEIYLNGKQTDTLTAVAPCTYYMNHTLVVAHDAQKTADGCAAPVNWESGFAHFHEVDGFGDTTLNITGVGYENKSTLDEPDGPEYKYGELNGNPVINAGNHSWHFGSYTTDWSLNYKRYVAKEFDDETGNFIVENDC